ncbi:ATP-binding protein [candidate division CSSED10-310 bacterium]|uniref:ATP-binding protein n=1 Tax=candidate division CSSED10-310 bacterium TaxID=2855610 RepID=A0ABV6Z229_UNCC1
MYKIKIPHEEIYEKEYRRFVQRIIDDQNLSQAALNEITFLVERKFLLSIPSKTTNLELLRQSILGLVANVNLSLQTVEDIALAVDEACTNIIQHSYADTQEGRIDVTVELAKDSLTISMIDTGEKGQQFDPACLESYEKREYLERLERGGLGLYIIKTIMDEVEYYIQPGTYNRLRMLKYLKENKSH